MDPQLKIANETENQLLLSETLDEVLERYYSDEECLEKFVQLVDRYGGKEDEQLRSDAATDISNGAKYGAAGKMATKI